ncbi:FAD-dependent oxidoreductase [Kitasatospora sp. NPDC097643]|uniref:FAD-dependent oxidoreductase n=1 Tax=Kitasatospora sp. NPDC097643 TaxID=3157230 RepID=UPI00331CCF98
MRIAVIGAGVIGLTTALRLQEKGFEVTVVTADDPGSTTSSVAAAVWYPVGMEDSSRVANWSALTFAEFTRQASDQVPGVTMRRTRMLAQRPDADPAVPWWGAVVPDLRRLEPSELGPAYSSGWQFTAPTVDMPVYLPWLLGRFLDAGGNLVRQRLNSLHQVHAWKPDAVVNASGLGAHRLCGDHAMQPIRGQLVLVRNPGLRDSLRVQDDPAGYTYVHPRDTDVVLGGTFDQGSWDTTADPATARAILARCTAHVPELRGAEIIGHPVGLRPARQGGVRLQVDTYSLPGTRVVHNYGHGGAGVTLGWGCADTAAALVTPAA